MCARRFLLLIFVLTVIVVGGAFALYQFGDQVLLRQATPHGRFQAPPGGGAPVYRESNLWIARPDFAADPSRWRPDGVPAAAAGNAAIFYIHPTTYLERDQWNAPFTGNVQSEARATIFVQSQASAFNGAGEVWAPRYRQAAYGAFLLNSPNAQKALTFAYLDVELAFEEFLRQISGDRPIILAAHSQGALHLTRLLARHRGELRSRLVAAYVVGWPVGITSDLPAMGLGPCMSPGQTGCVMSWQSFMDPANTRLVTEAWVGSRGLTGAERRRDDMLCTNPLTSTKDGAAPPAANNGTLVPNGDLSKARLEPRRVGARCDEGFLKIDGDIPTLGPYVLPGNNYHVYDYALFWGSIRADAERRLAAWGKR